MTELERKALLGDKQAQQECTEKGIVLPCPFCGAGGAYFVRIYTGFYLLKCKTCGGTSDVSCGKKMTIGCWNTRPAPPIGRCGECAHRFENEECEYECEIHNICPDDNFYCKDFELKENEENE